MMLKTKEEVREICPNAQFVFGSGQQYRNDLPVWYCCASCKRCDPESGSYKFRVCRAGSLICNECVNYCCDWCKIYKYDRCEITNHDYRKTHFELASMIRKMNDDAISRLGS